MTVTLVNYADRAFYEAQKINARSGLEIGGFDRVVSFGRGDLDWYFRMRNGKTLGESRGAGYWVWKPYIIAKTLRRLKTGDVLFYCDSGSKFINSFKPIIDICNDQDEKKVLLFTLEEEHRNRVWTKRDCFYYMGLDGPSYADAVQILSGFVLCVKNEFSVSLIAEWLRYAQDARILTDAPNQCGLPNYPEFREHRHDQSILSLLAVKHRITTEQDISQFGNDRRPPEIPQMIDLTRCRA